MQLFADHPAKRGFNLFARHGLVERLINEGLVAVRFHPKRTHTDQALVLQPWVGQSPDLARLENKFSVGVLERSLPLP